MAKRTQEAAFREALFSEEAEELSGAEWRKQREEGIPVKLPFGKKLVYLRTVRPDHLLMLGSIPDVLTALVVDLVYGTAKPDDVDKFIEKKESAADALAMLESLRVVCEAAMVKPRVVAEPLADDEIRIDDIEIADRGYIFRLVFMPSDALSRFRYQPPADVDVVADGQRDEQQTV